MPLALAPRMEVVGTHGSGEARSLGHLHILEQLAWRKLFVGSVISNKHNFLLLASLIITDR
jgi:hypothetical protein